MKNSLFSLALCICATLTSYAQTSADDSDAAGQLKPTAGSIATELNVNPFNGTLSLNNAFNQLKFRYFTPGNHAFRVGITGSRNGHIDDVSNPYGTNPTNYRAERNTTSLGLSLGVERHFTGTDRLSPYIGGDITLVNKSTTQEITQGQSVTTTTGAWHTYSYPTGNPNQPMLNTNERAYLSYGINLVTGFDFYMARHFFFGYELNFGFSKMDWKQLKTEQSTSGGGSGSGSGSNNDTIKSSTYSFGPNLMNGIRIGYVF